MVFHLLVLSLCVCTHIDTLPLTAPYVPTRGTPCPLRLCVLMEQTHNTPGPTYGEAGAYPVSVVHHGDQAPPSSFPLSQPRIAYLPGLCEGYGCLRTGAQSSKQARCKTFFSSWQTLCSGSTWKSGKEKKKNCGCCQGMYADCFYPWYLWGYGRLTKKHQLWILARFNFKDNFTLLHLFNNKRGVGIFCQFFIRCHVVCAICSQLMTVGKIYKYFEDTNFHKDNKAKIVPLSKKLQLNLTYW